MKNFALSFLRLGVAAVLAVWLITPATAQQSPQSVEVGGVEISGLPDDWSHHHVVFSNPGTEQEALAKGTYDRWLSVVNDPRYIIQQLKRRTPAQGPAAEDVARIEGSAKEPNVSNDDQRSLLTRPANEANLTSADQKSLLSWRGESLEQLRRRLHKDWSIGLDGAAATATGTVGTLNSSNISGSSSVTIATTTLTASAPTAASQTGSFSSATSTPSGDVTITSGSDVLTLTATTGTSSSSCTVSGTSSTGSFHVVEDNNSTNRTANAASLATLISATNCGSFVGVSATSSSAIVTVKATTPGSGGNSIALGDALSDFSWTNTTLANGADGTTSGTTFAYWLVNNYVSPSVLATNIATAINDNATLEGTTGVMANSSSNVVTVTARTNGTSGNSIALSKTSFSAYTWSPSGDLSGGATGTGKVQPNTYPAKYGVSLTGASCSDFVIYPTGQAGSTGVASVIAYYNLYTTGCTGAVPSAYWAYNTGGTVTTSPVLSLDGSQVAFMQVSGTTASLVLLKWAAGPPVTLTSQSSGSAYRSCTAPCMYTLAFANGKNDTFSAPFYDYGHDVLYVGDDSGNLHQFTGVFNGSPVEAGSPWPVALDTNKLSSPVYDCECGFEGGYVFVGDFGGVFYSVGTGYGGTTNGQIHGNTGSIGDAIADAPLVDSSEGIELVFVTTNGSYSYTGDNGVWEFVSSFTDLGTPGVVPVGTGGTGYYLYAGSFDNVYFESGNPAYGHLYVAGNTGTAGGGTLYQVDIVYSSLTEPVNAVVSGLNSTEHPWPSPLTEFCNNGTSACAITSQRSVTGRVSTTSPEITLSSGTFTSADVGAYVTGTDTSCSGHSCIPFGDTISSVLSSTTANLSTAPSGSVSSESLAIQGGQTTSGTDYVFFSVNEGAKTGCTDSAGNGCILSYNVSNPTSVSLSGSGLNVTTPDTNGCWATGGFVIDNSDQLTSGAQQIYFVNLNGATAGGPSGNTSSACTSGTASLNATQASQANP